MTCHQAKHFKEVSLPVPLFVVPPVSSVSFGEPFSDQTSFEAYSRFLDGLDTMKVSRMYTKGFKLAQFAWAIILLTYSGCCIANPIPAAPSKPASISALGDISEPTCTAPEIGKSNASSPQYLHTFPRECIESADYFFNFPMVARIAWHWKRVEPGQPPQPGYNFLPLSAAPTTCMITLDVLDDPAAEDQFALVQIADDFRALFRKCVHGRVEGPSAGFIPVGPRKVLKLSVGPIPPDEMHNLTAGGYEMTNDRLQLGPLGKDSSGDVLVV